MKKRTITILALAIAVLPASFGFADAPEDIVNNMFNEVLKRNPTHEEFDRYMDLVIENGWDNSDLKRILRQKKSDAYEREFNSDYDREYDRDRGYDRDRRYSDRDYYDKRRWVEYAFEDEIGRLPTRNEMDEYCDICLEERYSQSELNRRIASDYRNKPRNRRQNGNDHYDYDRYSSDEEVEYIIEDLFRKELGRDVDDASMRKYRRLMIDQGWSERRVSRDLAKNPILLREDLEKIVVRAFEDLLDRRPRPRERDEYVDNMMDLRWDERKVRDMIKRSSEYTYDRPREFIDKAYRQVLLREPDAGAYGLTQQILRKDWSLEDVKNHLRRSQEYRTKTIPKMLEMVYAELLNRKPDAYGINYYTKRAQDGWTLEDIKDHIRSSDEYSERGTGK